MNRYYPPVMEVVQLPEMDVITTSIPVGGDDETGAF